MPSSKAPTCFSGQREIEDLADELAPGWPRAAVNQFLLACGEEALGDGVVVGAAIGAHRDGDASVAGLLAEAEADILTALDGMMPEAATGPAAVQRHLERVDDELGAHMLGHRPADDPARKGVLNGGEVDPAFPAAQVGDVGDPQHVGRGATKAPFDQVVGDANAWEADRCPAALAGHQSRQAGGWHEALHTLARHDDTVAELELSRDTPRCVDAAILGVDGLDALDQPHVGQLGIRRRARRPRLEARR
jgi:hypothetical protein